jgi:hypothetical protein
MRRPLLIRRLRRNRKWPDEKKRRDRGNSARRYAQTWTLEPIPPENDGARDLRTAERHFRSLIGALPASGEPRQISNQPSGFWNDWLHQSTAQTAYSLASEVASVYRMGYSLARIFRALLRSAGTVLSLNDTTGVREPSTHGRLETTTPNLGRPSVIASSTPP